MFLVFLGSVSCATLAQASPHFLVGSRRDAGPHPRSLLGPQHLDRVRSRLGREPYRTLYARVWSWANRSYSLGEQSISGQQVRANAARAAAYVHLLDRKMDHRGRPVPFADLRERELYGRKAADQLLAMNTASRAGGVDYTLDIHTAQELQMWADTLDLLLAAGREPLGTRRAQAVQNLADLAADFYADYELESWLFLRSMVNNHRSKSAAALGVAALVLNGETFVARKTDGRYDPARWLDFAHRYIDMSARDILTDDDGGCQEGSDYLAYAGINVYGWLWAWHHYSGGATFALDWNRAPLHYRFHARGEYTLPDLWRAPWLEKQFFWALRLFQPNRRVAAFDDCSPGVRLHFGLMVRPGVPHAGLFRWAWRQQGYHSTGSVDQSALLLATFDDSVPEQTPTEARLSPDAVMPWGGQVVLRSGWDERAVQLTLLCEHGKAAGWGQNRWGDFVDGLAGHEHPDPGSFELHAFGEALAIDSGYMSWTYHDLVNRPDNHNIVLVDGKGPQLYRLLLPDVEYDGSEVKLSRPEQEGGYGPALDGMAYLLARDVNTDGVKLAEVATRYSVHVPLTDLVRRAVLLGGRTLVLHDRIRTVGRGGSHHRYSFQLHGNGGHDSGGSFARIDQGGLWTRPKARLRAVVSATDQPPLFSTRAMPHDPGNRRPKAHTVLDATVEARAGDLVEFLAVLVPEENTASGYESIPLAVSRSDPGAVVRWQQDGHRCTAWTGRRREVHGPTQLLIRADAGAYCENKTNIFGYFHGGPGDSERLLTARFTLDAGGRVSGFRLTVHRGAQAGRVTLDLPRVPGKVPTGHCQQEIAADRWQLTAQAPAVVTSGAVRDALIPNLALLGRPQNRPTVPLGQPMRLSAAGTCGPLATNAALSWALLRRPELSKVGLGDTENKKEISLLADLPGLYRLELTARSAGHLRRTTLDVEVEGEPPWPGDGGSLDAGSTDAGASDSGAPDSGPGATLGGGGCAGCAVPGQPKPLFPLWMFGILWVMLRRKV